MQFEKWFKTDLQQPLEVQELKGIFFTGDEDGNLIGFEVYNGSTAATLSGTCVGYIIRPDGVTVTETGTISSNKASIVLPAAAYYHEGAIDIVIKVTATNNRVAVGAVRAYVQRSTTNVYADPSPVVPIPTVEELLEIIELCEQATTDAQNAAGALNNMDAVATTLTAGSDATASITTVDGHYRITLGIPRGNTGATGATGATGQTGSQGIQGIQGIPGDPASITSQVNSYQASTNGVNVPTGEWSSTIPNVPQGSYLWIRTVLTWNGGSTTTLYSVSRMGVDGSGSVSSVNSISPDGNGNVVLPYDSVPTEDSVFPCTSGGVYDALLNKQQTLTFDTVPTYQSTNPVTSDGIYTALSGKVSKSGDTMIGDLNIRNGHHFGVISPSINITTTPAEYQGQYGLVIADKNFNIVGFVNCYQKTSGTVGLQIIAGRPINGSYVSNGIALEVAPDGTFGVGVSAPTWRKALNGQDIKVRSGTTVIMPSSNSTSETVITNAQLQTMFGITDSAPTNTTVVMSNGDYVSNAIGVSSIYNSNVQGWKALFSEAISTPIRINWIAVYYGL